MLEAVWFNPSTIDVNNLLSEYKHNLLHKLLKCQTCTMCKVCKTDPQGLPVARWTKQLGIIQILTKT